MHKTTSSPARPLCCVTQAVARPSLAFVFPLPTVGWGSPGHECEIRTGPVLTPLIPSVVSGRRVHRLPSTHEETEASIEEVAARGSSSGELEAGQRLSGGSLCRDRAGGRAGPPWTAGEGGLGLFTPTAVPRPSLGQAAGASQAEPLGDSDSQMKVAVLLPTHSPQEVPKGQVCPKLQPAGSWASGTAIPPTGPQGSTSPEDHRAQRVAPAHQHCWAPTSAGAAHNGNSVWDSSLVPTARTSSCLLSDPQAKRELFI